MALSITGGMKVKTLRADFLEEFGLTLRVYDGRSFADDHATLASIRKGDSKGGEFAPKRNTKVGNLEDKIMEMFGIKTQVAGSDDSYLCDNDLTLAGALEADEKKMGKKVKKTENKLEANDDAIISETESAEETRELTDEEKTWLEDLWNLDEAPEVIRASKAFMQEALKEDGSSLEYASDALKNDKDIVLEAVKESGSSLEYASGDLKSDVDVLIEAAKSDSTILRDVPKSLKNEVLNMIGKSFKAGVEADDLRTMLWSLEEEGIIHEERVNEIEYSFAEYLGETLDFDESEIDEAEEEGYGNVGIYTIEVEGSVGLLIERIEDLDDERAQEAVEKFRSLMREYI